MHYFYRLITFLVALAISSYAHAVITVGATADCDYDNIEAAVANVNALTPTIFVANDKTYTDNLTINKSVYIYGGYETCQNAREQTLGNNFSDWRGTVKVNAQRAVQSTVIIQQFKINNGFGENGFGGGIDVKGKSTLLLYNSLVSENRAQVNGGGINVSGGDAILKLIDSNVMFNEANGAGGGIQCKDSAKVFIEGNSSVSNNTAGAAGGGIFAHQSCEITIQRGGNGNLALNQNAGSISGNIAIRGGGIAIASGARVKLNGEGGYPAKVLGNSATYGGGVSVFGQGSIFTGFNARVDENTARDYAGGFLVSGAGAIFVMRHGDHGGCHDPNRCSSLSGNKVTINGGYAAGGVVANEAAAVIAQTHINENLADQRVVFDVGTKTNVILEGNAIYRNKPFNSGVIPSALMYLDNGAGSFTFRYTTLANNINQAAFELNAATENKLNIFNSIIYNLGSVLDQQNNTNNLVQAYCSVMREKRSLTGNVAQISTSSPNFVDMANDDFRLKPDSVAVDMCNESIQDTASMYADILGIPRGHDHPKQNHLGPYDAGAYEIRSDLIFSSDFE